jgi:tRNA(Arg) A34 adenosine deaminase TadA
MAEAPFTAQDEWFLRRALELAQENVRRGDGGPFGALIVKDGRIIAEGWNRVIAACDPTAHAEIEAIRAACRQLGHFHLESCTLYASSEPCPLCLAAANWAQVARIIYANGRERAAAIGFSDSDLYQELQRPGPERRIPTLRLSLPEAEAPLKAWAAKADKIPY